MKHSLRIDEHYKTLRHDVCPLVNCSKYENKSSPGLMSCYASGGNTKPVIRKQKQVCSKVTAVSHQYFDSDNAECPQ